MSTMKYIFLFCLAVSAALAGEAPPTGAASPAPERFTLGPGDVADISVWKNPDLTRRVTVLPDGVIHFPLAGEIRAAGLTVPRLTQRVKERLEAFMPDPQVSISIHKVNSLVVYVTGRVNRPGRFLIPGHLRVLQVLALSGGLTPFAREGQIWIFRETDTGKEQIRFNYKRLCRGEDLEQNIRLERGDIIVVK